MKKEICLYPLEQLALILPEPTGIIYYNQVGGIHCLQYGAEGVLVFVEDDIKSLYNAITRYTENIVGLKEEDADFLDSQFMRFKETNYLRVDRTKLEKSVEAWIHVVFEPSLPEYKPRPNDLSPSFRYGFTFTGFTSKTGILTWNNSD